MNLITVIARSVSQDVLIVHCDSIKGGTLIDDKASVSPCVLTRSYERNTRFQTPVGNNGVYTTLTLVAGRGAGPCEWILIIYVKARGKIRTFLCRCINWECVWLFHVLRDMQAHIETYPWSSVLLISQQMIYHEECKKYTAVVICSLSHTFYGDIMRLRIKPAEMKKFINGIVLRDSLRLLFWHSNNCKFIQAGADKTKEA